MSKAPVRRSQRKPVVRKRQEWDTSINDLSQHRLSDDEASRRKQAFQSRNSALIQEEKQRKILAKAVNGARRNHSNQLGILREILFNERDIDELMQRSNGVLQNSRSDKFVPKSSVLRSGKNHFTSLTDNRAKKTSATSTRPTSARNLNSPGGADWNQSEEDHLSVSSGDGADEELENEPVRLARSNIDAKKNDQHHHHQTDSARSSVQLLNDREQQHPTLSQGMNRSSSLYSQTRPPANGARTANNVSFLSDVSKYGGGGKTNGTDLVAGSTTNQLKILLDRLATEMNELETITGFKSDKNDQLLSHQSNTCSTALVTALIALTGHVKQCAIGSKGNMSLSSPQHRQEIGALKDQLSVVVKAQLDFQQKIENQISMLQTMMQTVCQLVNNEIISNKKYSGGGTPGQQSPTMNYSQQSQPTSALSRLRREQSDLEFAEPRPNWMNNNNNSLGGSAAQVQRQTLLPKNTGSATDELLAFAQRNSNVTSTDQNFHRQSAVNNRHSTYIETLETSKKLTRPTSATSTVETNGMPSRRHLEQESRSSLISPVDLPTSYDMFESGLPNVNPSMSILRSTAATAPSASTNETILEKILHERLLLVQQIAELNKQHELTQGELANLEANTAQQRATT